MYTKMPAGSLVLLSMSACRYDSYEVASSLLRFVVSGFAADLGSISLLFVG
jgi:hypothetical protein